MAVRACVLRGKGCACKWVVVNRTGESVEGKFRIGPRLVGVEGTCKNQAE